MRSSNPVAIFMITILAMTGMWASAPGPADGNAAAAEELPSFNFDFGSMGSPVKELFQGVTSSTTYTSRRGFGLLEDASEFQVTPRMLVEVNPNVLQRSWVYGEYGNDLTTDGLRSGEKVSFRVDMPNGTYRLVIWLGDLEKGVYSMNVSVNDRWLLQGADAFHTVHRSMYFPFSPDPRNPELTYMNYGMAVPFYLKVEVTQGRMVINVTGNDGRYRDLLARELAKDPAYSYSVWMSTGTKKYSAGTGPWRYIGGPFTNASVLGMEIYPFPDFPIDRIEERFDADDDITDTQVLNAITGLNSGNLEGAFEHWKLSMERELAGRNKLARGQLGLILAGALPLDREIEILKRAGDDLRNIPEIRGDMAQVELLKQVDMANRGLNFEFERILYDQENPKNHFFEAGKAFVLLNMIPPDSPLHPKMRLWAARCLMNLDPHRWTSASGTALEMMEGLRHLDPGNPYIRMYLDTTREDPPTWEIPTPVISTTGVYDNWTLHHYNEGFGEAPPWALLMHEELGWLYDVTDWWVDNRMQENGYLGGGWTDDVEMIGLFGFDALISEGADDKSLEGAGRFVTGMLESGQVNMTLGYSEAFADVEHTAELTGDSLPMMVAVDFGNPKWIEFSTKTAVLMRDLWMGENEKGWYQFRSNYLSATRVGTGGQAEDSWINFRAVLPALWAWWYSNDPEVQKLIVDWADSWVRAALSTEKGKPEGVIPAGIGWPDGEIGGHASPNWYTAAHPAGSVNYDWAPQSYKSYIVTLLETAFDATRNLTFLEPLRLEAQIAQDYLDNPAPRPDAGSREWAGSILGSGAVSTYQSILDRYGLPGGGPSSTLWRPHTVVDSCEIGYQYIRKCYPLMTTEASATDRALFIGVANPFLIFTGGSIGGALLAPQFTYSGLERDFAAMVRDANSRTANISLYGFYEGGRDAAVVPWALEIGGIYRLVGGPDENSDGIRERSDQFVNFTFLTRGQKVPFELPGGKEYIVTIEQLQAGSGLRPLMPDPAFDEEDEVIVDKENGTVTVKVHNIGSEAAEDFDILLYEDLDGGLRHIGGALGVSIDAPSGLMPSIIDVDLTVWKEPWIGEVVIRIDPEDELQEITASNNELWGYWDLEGIKVTEPDEPIQMNGTIPIVRAYEDEPAENVLDLKEYIWDPDGHGLEYSVAGPRSYEWQAAVENGMVSFDLNGDIGENWSGELNFSGHCRGPGKDGVWETEDDTEVFEFDMVLQVLPVNDDPVLEAIVVNGTRHTPGENGFTFHLEYGEPFIGEIEWSDVDGDDVLLGLEEPGNGLTLINGTLMLTAYDDVSLIATNLTIMDDNDSAVQRFQLTINISVQSETSLTGISLDGKNVLIYREGDHINMTIFEREEWTIYFIFENATQSSIIELDDPHDIISISGTTAIVVGIDVAEEIDLFTAVLGWKGNTGWGTYRTLNFHLTVLNVNRAPDGLAIDAEGPFYVNESIVFNVTEAVDPDGDALTYTYDWGDGSVTGEWMHGEEFSHVFLEA
ncbi:MAG: hypothetical protein ACMUHU_05025 [Thermoplasmatota archaeon]